MYLCLILILRGALCIGCLTIVKKRQYMMPWDENGFDIEEHLNVQSLVMIFSKPIFLPGRISGNSKYEETLDVESL